MPIRVSYIDGGINFEVVAFGIVTGDDFIRANREIYSSPRKLLQLKFKIVDQTECTDYRVSGSDVRMMANQEREASILNRDLIIAVVSRTDLQYGISRMWQSYLDGTGLATAIFRDRESADVWVAGKLRAGGSRD
jgi:hypothetical protein